MKILYITDARLPTEKAHGLQIMKTCEALAHAGHNVELIAPRRRNSMRDDPFSYYEVSRSFSLRTLFTIDLIRFGRTGFLVQEISFAIAAAIFLFGRNGAIYSRDEVVLSVLSVLGYERMIWESHDGAWNLAARFVSRHVQFIAVVSLGLRDFYVEQDVPREKVIVIPNGIDLAQFEHPQLKSEARLRLSLPQNKPIALYIGRLDGWKGTRTLLEASKLLDSVCVALIGGGADMEKLKAQYPRVTFVGPRPYSELSHNQAAADVLVVPNTSTSLISTRFTSPLKLLAHMASNIPIVASDLPSIRELVGNDAALLVSPDNPQALAEGIKKILADNALAGKLARRARTVVERYSWTARAEAISAMLSRVL